MLTSNLRNAIQQTDSYQNAKKMQQKRSILKTGTLVIAIPIWVYLVRFQAKPSAWKTWNEVLWSLQFIILRVHRQRYAGAPEQPLQSPRHVSKETQLQELTVITYSLYRAKPSLHDSRRSTGARWHAEKHTCTGASVISCDCTCDETRYVRDAHRIDRSGLTLYLCKVSTSWAASWEAGNDTNNSMKRHQTSN